MHTSFGAALRLLASSAACLCSLALFVLAAPPCYAATGTGPTITNATISYGPTNILPVTGGAITVTATVTDPAAPLQVSKRMYLLNGAGYNIPVTV